MAVRQPYVSNQFYPGGAEECRAEVEAYVRPPEGDLSLPADPVAGVVPHAGWMFSGATAGHVFAVLAERVAPDVVVACGAVHDPRVRFPSAMTEGEWGTPLGPLRIDSDLARALVKRGTVRDDAGAHDYEHAIEVETPFLFHCFPEAGLVPVAVPPTGEAVQVGRDIAAVAKDSGRRVLVIASADMTHYGPRYGMTGAGLGQAGYRWVTQENDPRLIDLICRLDADAIVPEARSHRNTCGAGAIAATVAAAIDMGATQGVLVHYTTSHDVYPRGEPGDFVGYAGIVF